MFNILGWKFVFIISVILKKIAKLIIYFQSIRNIPKQDEYRKKVPSYELALSQVLRNIVVSRRKFMPKAHVVHYASHLRKLTTTMLDYLTVHAFPKTWPDNLDCFEIVVESYVYFFSNILP